MKNFYRLLIVVSDTARLSHTLFLFAHLLDLGLSVFLFQFSHSHGCVLCYAVKWSAVRIILVPGLAPSTFCIRSIPFLFADVDPFLFEPSRHASLFVFVFGFGWR